MKKAFTPTILTARLSVVHLEMNSGNHNKDKPKMKLHWPTYLHNLKKAFLLEWIINNTDNGHPERAFFQKFESFGLGQTNWAEILGCIFVISSQTIGTILAL